MANNCEFSMRITGGEAEIKELVSMLRREGQFKDAGLGRVYSFEVEQIESTDIVDIYQVDGYGDCAWSVLSAMRSDGIRHPSLERKADLDSVILSCEEMSKNSTRSVKQPNMDKEAR